MLNDQFFTSLWTKENLMIVTAVWVVLHLVKRVFPELAANKWYARFLPAYPVLMASAAVWIPGAVTVEMTTASKVFLGIVLGFFSGYATKFMSQTVMGKDSRISS